MADTPHTNGPESDPLDDGFDPISVNRDGVLSERRRIGDIEVVVHYDEVPESDITTVDGIRVTTPLRTVIDLAPDVDGAHLELMVQDCLDRRLFTLEEAWERLAQPDMATRSGAEALRRLLSSREAD